MTWSKDDAKKEIVDFFYTYDASANEFLGRAVAGKIYELYCLAKTVDWLKSRYDAEITYKEGNKKKRIEDEKTIDFKASPGKIDYDRSYFEVCKNNKKLELHVDIEIETLSNAAAKNESDRSGYHEIDLVLIDPIFRPEMTSMHKERPRHDQLLLGVECKSTKFFRKEIARQVLAVRRELSLFVNDQKCKLDLLFRDDKNDSDFDRNLDDNEDPDFNKNVSICVKADPASLYWLAFTDPDGKNYSNGPEHFGIRFKNWDVQL